MRVEWTKDLSTTVPEIDEQHKELFSRINSLLEACGRDKGKEVVGRTIAFLDDYVVTHFSTEEGLMARTAYPAYERHKQEHQVFIGRMADLKRKFHNEGADPDVVHLTTRTLVEWLDVHIRETDRALGEYLRSKNI